MNDEDAVAKSAYCLVRARHVRFPGDPQYGLIVTKRTFKHATQRNRAKRLLREWLRINAPILRDDLDYVLIARAPILDATRDEGVLALNKALRHLKRTVPVAPDFNASGKQA